MTSQELPYGHAIEALQKANKILFVSHRRPDGDTLGASSALHLALNQLNKKSTLACIDDVSHRLLFIPETRNYVKEFNIYDYDLIVISDAGASHMTGFQEKYPDFLSKKVPILNIDHHFSNDNFGTINIVDATASSATMIVWELLKKMNIQLTKEIALALLAGIYNDTGGLVHSNTTEKTFKAASELMKAGVNIEDVSRPLFKQSSFDQLKLWGHILENMKINEKKVLSSVVTQSDFKMLGAHPGDTGGIIDLMCTVPNIACAMLLAEDEGMVKGSLRTQRDDVNVSDLAAEFGGGGHKKAAGFRVHGRLEKEVMWKIIPA